MGCMCPNVLMGATGSLSNRVGERPLHGTHTQVHVLYLLLDLTMRHVGVHGCHGTVIIAPVRICLLCCEEGYTQGFLL